MVSIIVPIYNTLIYIGNGYAYILTQTYSDWEFLFVNEWYAVFTRSPKFLPGKTETRATEEKAERG